MSLLSKFSEEDYGMTEHMQKVEEDKKRLKNSKKQQKISLEIFYNFDGGFKSNNTTINSKKKEKTIDEQALNLDTYNAIMNNGSYNRQRNYNDILDF